ncbi:MAG: phosphopantetheine-binding protein [Lentilitoribacter sp.]
MSKLDLQSIQNEILATFNDLYKNQTGSAENPEIADDTVLLETGLDSLGFAILVTQLEEKMGFYPFSLSEEACYPSTFG